METYFFGAMTLRSSFDIDEEIVTYSNRHDYSVTHNGAGSLLIKVPLQKKSRISLSVYSLQSQVYSFFDNEILEEGNYEYTWNCSSYPAGIYLVKLYVDGNINAKKIIINK